ncbi:MAG: hypothetical protein ACE5FT_07670, partial [Candidatus Nanoarchaeia archaeon]
KSKGFSCSARGAQRAKIRMELPKIRRTLETRKNQIGLVGTRLDISEVPGNTLSAHITTDWKTIAINYGVDLDLVPDSMTASFVEKRSVEDPELKVGLDLVEHESGHRENPTGTKLGCPYSVEMHDAIKESVHKALTEKGKAGLEAYVTNAFEDVLNNVNCRRHTDFSGQTLFWNNQGLITDQEKFTPFYEAFVRINLVLGGSVPDNSLLKRFYTHSDEVRGSIKNFLGDIKYRLSVDHVVKLHEKSAFDTLFTPDLAQREGLWTALAYSFARNTADLLDQPPTEVMFGGSGPSENPFDKEMRVPKQKQEIAFKRYKEGKGPASHRDSQEQLYDLYKRISKEVKVETSSYSESQSMPLVHFGKQFIGENEQKFRFRGVGFQQDGSLGIKTSKHEIKYPVSYKVHPRNFPRFKLALMDRSGSMEQSPNDEGVGDTSFIPWGDNSYYHFALKGYFGIENFLERQGISHYVQSCVLGFSGENAVRGEAKEVAKSLLTKPSGGTSLDIDGLERELSGNALVLSISDGDMTLGSDVEERFERKIQQSGTNYAHIQIGEESKFSTYLRGIGVPVFTVKGDDDLARTMISFVSGYYKAQRGRKND